MKSGDIDYPNLWEQVAAQFRCGADFIHGASHWRRVEKNGLLLATKTGADITVVRLFAVFHDSCRVNECVDDGHGLRGATLAASLRGRCSTSLMQRLLCCTTPVPGHTEKHLSHLPDSGHLLGLRPPRLGADWGVA